MSENKDKGRVQNVAKFKGNTAMDPKAKDISAKPGTHVSYFRPSGSRGFYFYNGLIENAYAVQFPSGQREVVVALN